MIQPRGGSKVKPSTEITEMVPVREVRMEPCWYCGKQQRIIHLLRNTKSGVDAPVCFPCFRNGFGWLMERFPGEFSPDKRLASSETSKFSE